MIRAAWSDLQFMQVMVFDQDPDLIAMAREPITKKVDLFLIIGAEEKIYQRDSKTNSWRPLETEDLSYILQSICHAVNSGLTVLKIDGKADSITNINN
jgi:hypothetical protein